MNWNHLTGIVDPLKEPGDISGTANSSYNFDLSPTPPYKYYRILGTAGTIRSDYIREAFFNQIGDVCDQDGDGVVNELDTNFDGDVCFDAIEAGHGQAFDDETGQLTPLGPSGVDGIGIPLSVSNGAGGVNYDINTTATSGFLTAQDCETPFECPQFTSECTIDWSSPTTTTNTLLK